MLALFSDIERRDGPMVAHDACPYFAQLALVVGQNEVEVLGFGH
jgi:hypothetical protein